MFVSPLSARYLAAVLGGDSAVQWLLHTCWNFNPHQIERARELRAVICDARRAPALAVPLLLIEDRVPMIEGVEHLREPEGVLCENGELQRSHDLLDDIVEPRGL